MAFTHQGCCRLQQLEQHHRHQTSSSVSLQAELLRIVDWMHKNDGASEQVADVLRALQREQDDHRQAPALHCCPFTLGLPDHWCLYICARTLKGGHHMSPFKYQLINCLSLCQMSHAVSILCLGNCSSIDVVCGGI